MPALPVIPADAPQFTNAPQLARWLRVHPRTIHRWVKEGILPQPIRMTARTLWFEVNAVRAALAKLFNPPGGEGGYEVGATSSEPSDRPKTGD